MYIVFPAFTSIRRKPKSDSAHQQQQLPDLESHRQRSLSHSESVVESLSSHQEATPEPSSPVSSQNPPPTLRNVSSFNGSFTAHQNPTVRRIIILFEQDGLITLLAFGSSGF